MNRFNQLNSFKKFLLITSFLLAIIIILELGTYTFAFLLYVTGFTDGNAFKEYKEKFHPLFTKRPLRVVGIKEIYDWSEYDPWYGLRNKRNFEFGMYTTDKWGFIHNGHDWTRNIYFKPKNIFRIFILGGSTVAGHGASHPDKTIPAQLEKFLNMQKPHNSKYTFQVINAGVASYYSPTELAYLEFEVINFQPDMIIVFNGYNDILFKVVMESNNNENINRYHWSTRHEYLKTTLDNPPAKLQLPEKFQFWRYSYFLDIFAILIDRIESRYHSKATEAKEKKMYDFIIKKYPSVKSQDLSPVYKFRAELDYNNWLPDTKIKNLIGKFNEKNILHYVDNICYMQSIANIKKIPFLSVLQPMLIREFKSVFSPEESMLYDINLQYLAQKIHCDSNKTIYESSKKASSELSKSLDGSFIDLTKLFYSIEQRTYSDWVHYNDLGNQIISRHLVPVVLDKAMKDIEKRLD